MHENTRENTESMLAESDARAEYDAWQDEVDEVNGDPEMGFDDDNDDYDDDMDIDDDDDYENDYDDDDDYDDSEVDYYADRPSYFD